jgi:hypothetical protein
MRLSRSGMSGWGRGKRQGCFLKGTARNGFTTPSAQYSAAPSIRQPGFWIKSPRKTGFKSSPRRARLVSDKQTVLRAPFPLKFPKYPLLLKSTDLLNISGIIDWFNTMIREFIARLRTRAKEIAEALIAKIGPAIRKYTPSCPPSAGIHRLIVPTESGNALNAGKRYRLTSGHTPVFSLYTFFSNRQ